MYANIVHLYDQCDNTIDTDSDGDGDDCQPRRQSPHIVPGHGHWCAVRRSNEVCKSDRHNFTRQDKIGADRARNLFLLKQRAIGTGSVWMKVFARMVP